MKRRVDDTRLREIVRARLTKGDAFRKFEGPITYAVKQQQVADELSAMTRAEIMAKWPECTYDLK